MNYSKYRISLDIHDTNSQAMLNIKKDDTARKIYFSLTDGVRPYQIATGCTAVFRAKKPDGKILYNTCDITDNIISYTLTNQTSSAVGTVECELTLYGEDYKQITSPRFTLIVDDVLATDSEAESTNEFTALTKAISETNNLNISASKDGKIAKITVTKKDGTPQIVTVYDGAQGEKGDTGEQGLKGDKGDTGMTGPQGVQGEKGDKGDTGEQGPQGIQGAKGDKGDTPQKGIDYFTDDDIASLNIPSVDQTYTPDSENAQSGKAVAEAIKSIPHPSWHNIETITTTEALGTVSRKFGSLNGEITYPAAAKVHKIQVYLTVPPNADATTPRLECRIADTNHTRIFMWGYISTTDTQIGWIMLERHAKWIPTFPAPQTKSENTPNTTAVQTYTCSADNLMMMGTENVRYLSFYGQLPAGTVIDIWGYYDEG